MGCEKMINRVEHVGIMVSNMEESISFYELLDFKVHIAVNNGEKEITFLKHDGLPGFEIELIKDLQADIPYSEHGLVNHLAFVVDQMDQVIIRLKQKAIEFLTDEPKTGINGRKTIRFKGPNGEMLQLVEER